MALISFLPSTPKNNTTVSRTPTKSPSPHFSNPRKIDKTAISAAASPKATNMKNAKKKKKKIKRPPPPLPPPKAPSSWEQFKSLLSCKITTATAPTPLPKNPNSRGPLKLSSACGSSICAMRDVVHGSTRVTDHSSSDDSGSRANDTTPLSSRSGGGGGMQLMKLSGCYECHAVDVHSVSRRYPRPRPLCPCAECGEVFTKAESLEQHQAIRHAVSELGPEDSGRNIVEIIFKSSWGLNKDKPICVIDRILKVHNTQRTIARFEDYRDAVKARAAVPRSSSSRCAADGNELLRFHCAALSCPLDSTSLCLSPSNPVPCAACTVLRHGFSRSAAGVLTTASSGSAHDRGPRVDGGSRAMLVCRVIAGRVRRSGAAAADVDVEGQQPYDSVAGDGTLEELFVANPRAILPCFVVIYRASSS